MGVNNRVDLAAVEAEARRRILEAHMLAGVTVVDPGSTWIDAGVEIAADARIEPGTSLRGATSVGAGAVVGPLTHADRQRRSASSPPSPTPTWSSARSATAARSAPSPTCAPAPCSSAGAKAGTFVEIKNSQIGEGAKVPHLAYVGDADVGAGSNLGAGTITANYDGFRKHRTVIGARRAHRR